MMLNSEDKDNRSKKSAQKPSAREEKDPSDPPLPQPLTGRRKAAAILKMLILIGIIVGIPAYILFCQRHILTDMKSFSTIVGYLRTYKKESFLLYLAAQILQILISFLPGEVFQFAAGYLFGVIPGLILSVIGAALGTLITFYVAKFLGEDALALFIKPENLIKYRKMMNSERAYISGLPDPGNPKGYLLLHRRNLEHEDSSIYFTISGRKSTGDDRKSDFRCDVYGPEL